MSHYLRQVIVKQNLINITKHRCTGAANIKDDPAFQCAAIKCMLAYLDVQKQRQQGLVQSSSRETRRNEKRKVARAAAKKNAASKQVECHFHCNSFIFVDEVMMRC
jgi:hypothetical protein